MYLEKSLFILKTFAHIFFNSKISCYFQCFVVYRKNFLGFILWNSLSSWIWGNLYFTLDLLILWQTLFSVFLWSEMNEYICIINPEAMSAIALVVCAGPFRKLYKCVSSISLWHKAFQNTDCFCWWLSSIVFKDFHYVIHFLTYKDLKLWSDF